MRQAGHRPLDESFLATHILDRNSSQFEAVVDKSSWSVQDAKNHFSTVIEAARREPQTVTKHGKPAVVVVDVAEYERLRQRVRSDIPSFPKLLLAIPQDDEEFERVSVRLRDIEL